MNNNPKEEKKPYNHPGLRCSRCEKQIASCLCEPLVNPPQALKDSEWERKLEEELYFLSQDGYGYEWREEKIKDIKSIIRSLLSKNNEMLVAEIKSMNKKIKYPKGFDIIDTDSLSRIIPNKNYNLALSDVVELIKSKK